MAKQNGSNPNGLNSVRSAALKQIERSERNFKLAFWSAVLVEGIFFVAFFWLADFKKDTTHLLLLLSTVASYTILVLGLIALGAHMSRNIQLVLRAIELLDEQAERPDGGAKS